MVWTFVHLDEALQPFDSPHYTGNTTVCAVANSGILRMAGKLHFAFLGNRHNPPEEMLYPLPHSVSIRRSALELS